MQMHRGTYAATCECVRAPKRCVAVCLCVHGCSLGHACNCTYCLHGISRKLARRKAGKENRHYLRSHTDTRSPVRVFFCFRFLLLASSITHCLASCRLCFSTSANTSTHPHTHTHTETSREMHGQLGRHTVEPGSQRARVEASAHVPVLQN